MNFVSINSEKVWNLYRIFYIAQSTAFIVPILYIYLQNEFNLLPEEILKLSSFYALLSLFLELPCAVIADRWGSKSNLYTCLGLQIVSCLALLLVNSKFAYHIYLICTYTAAALCAGASSVLIKKHFLSESEEKFQEYIFNLQNSFYRITSLFILSSAVLYTFYPVIPFILQILNFLVSLGCLMQIPEQYISIKKSSSNIVKIAKNDIGKSLAFIKGEKYYAYLIICSIIFGLGIDINHKSIQSQLYALIGEHQVLFIGCTITIGNLFSSYGAKLMRRYLLSKISQKQGLCTLGLLLIISYLLMSINILAFTIAGFMLINAFKGCYRPIISAEIINLYPFKSSLNTNLAVVHVICIISAALIQYGISFSYFSISHGNFFYALFTLIVLGIGFLCSSKTSQWKIKGCKGLLTEKIGLIEKNKEGIFYLQFYPKNIDFEYLNHIAKMAESGKYPTKPIQPFMESDKIGIKTPYMGDLHLSDILDPLHQYAICQRFFNASNHKPYTAEEKYNLISEKYIFKPQLLQILQKEQKLSERGVIHGDLNPENILVVNDNAYVIDWDLSCEGPFWYDLLSLLTHPHIYFDKKRRIDLFLNHANKISKDEAGQIFYAFCQYKARQLQKLTTHHHKYATLSKQYEEASGQYNEV